MAMLIEGISKRKQMILSSFLFAPLSCVGWVSPGERCIIEVKEKRVGGKKLGNFAAAPVTELAASVSLSF